MAASLDKDLEKQKKYYQKMTDYYDKKAHKFDAKGKTDKANEYRELANEAKAGASSMQAAQDELREIGDINTPQAFTFQHTYSNLNPTLMDNTGTIVIHWATAANAIHELKHAYQHLVGKVELFPRQDPKIGYDQYTDLYDEVEAYRREYFFDPTSITAISKSYPITTYKDITTDNVKSFSIKDPNTNISTSPYMYFSKEYLLKPGSKAWFELLSKVMSVM